MSNSHVVQPFQSILDSFTYVVVCEFCNQPFTDGRPNIGTHRDYHESCYQDVIPCPHCGSIECDGYWSPCLGGCPKHPDRDTKLGNYWRGYWDGFETGMRERKIEIEEEL